MLGNRAADGTERALVKLLIGALGIYPAGTMVTLNTGELGVVMGTPSHAARLRAPAGEDPLRRARQLARDAHRRRSRGAASRDSRMRFIAKSVDADEQQMKAMRSYVVAATAAKRRGALDPEAEQVPRSSPRGHGDLPPPQRMPASHPAAQSPQQRPVAEATLQSAIGDADELAARITRPPIVIDESMPTHRPPKNEPTTATTATTAPPPRRASMEDVAIHAARPGEATPRSAQHVAAGLGPRVRLRLRLRLRMRRDAAIRGTTPRLRRR